MELTHQFTVPVPIEDAWSAFNDLERVAPCFPGAALTSYDGESFEGLVKVKLGPISLQYTGAGRFVERDEAAHRAVIEAKGKDKRGNGTAAANITATLESAGDASTNVVVATDLNITGKPAQFGRGVMQDVSDKLLGQFATCLESKLGQTDEEAPTSKEAVGAGAGGAHVAADAAETIAASSAEPKPAPVPRKRAAKKTVATKAVAGGGAATESESLSEAATAAAKHRADSTASRLAATPVQAPPPPAAAELDLGTTVVPVLLKRYAPRIVAGLIALWLLKKLFSRS